MSIAMPEIKNITDKSTWDAFVTSQKSHTFLHSWAWGELNEKMGDKIWRLGLYDSEKLIAVALLIKVHAKRGNFLFVPHGPIIAAGRVGDSLAPLIDEFKKIGKTEGVNFIRISPLLKKTEQNQKIFKELGFRNSPIHMHAEVTWTLDLAKEEYNIYLFYTPRLIRRAVSTR